MSPAQVGDAYDAMVPALPADLDARVIKGKFGRPGAQPSHEKPVYTPSVDPAVEAEREVIVHQLETKARDDKPANPETERFWRARDLISRSEAGKPIGQEEAKWVTEYVKTAEYEGLLSMLETFGKDAIV